MFLLLILFCFGYTKITCGEFVQEFTAYQCGPQKIRSNEAGVEKKRKIEFRQCGFDTDTSQPRDIGQINLCEYYASLGQNGNGNVVIIKIA